ncbi:hypothetical protein [Pseudoalteromonas luteoviolacea]|uniref:Uncharacterized protein n=1 Tax=Pseudoalteromonas luteoviolacea NCIMB 1942 TaxID=1365253 RepID=A0A167B092_9GAMM|nr:hypothetical protein [Pseudoalteromonas luteoviolacea]KZN46009.1 hypothetical protein N482_13115 [Pseudoalteromonas luteoviolacea NCIMB 1942]
MHEKLQKMNELIEKAQSTSKFNAAKKERYAVGALTEAVSIQSEILYRLDSIELALGLGGEAYGEIG